MGVHEHKKAAPASVCCAIVTVSDSRTADTDLSGREIRKRLEAAGHRVTVHELVADDPERVVLLLRELAGRPAIDCVLLNGGTGVAPRDHSFEAVSTVLTRRLEGFGELFRMLSYAEVGAAAMLSRAVAGVVNSTVVFSLPGSTAACRLALDKLILPELGHVVSLANPAKWGA